MRRYDFFIAGRWRNRNNIQAVANAVRASGKTAYCFVEHNYDADGVTIHGHADPELFV